MRGIFEILTKFPLEKCIHLPRCDAYFKCCNTCSIVNMCECDAQCNVKIPIA